MFYDILKAKDMVNLDGGKFERKILLENNNSSLSIIALKKENIIHLQKVHVENL